MSIETLSPFTVHDESASPPYSEMLDVLNATRGSTVCKARFEWLYEKNPDGAAVVWTIRTGKRDEMAGFTAAFPRRMLINGDLVTGWNCADFSILPRYRSLGPAIKLRRAAKLGVEQGRISFLYAHPNQRMAAIHRRVGHSVVGRMVRLARVLKTGPYLEQRVGSRVLGAVAGAVCDPLLRLVSREFWHRNATEVVCSDAPDFDKRFDDLFDTSSGQLPVVGVRDQRYLTWRYTQNPLYKTHALLSKQVDQLRGYLLFTVQDNSMFIKDLFPPTDTAAMRDLISAAIREGVRRRLRSISFTVLDGNDLIPLLRSFGFCERPDGSEMFAYAEPTCSIHAAIADRNSWFLTVGDRDV